MGLFFFSSWKLTLPPSPCRSVPVTEPGYLPTPKGGFETASFVRKSVTPARPQCRTRNSSDSGSIDWKYRRYLEKPFFTAVEWSNYHRRKSGGAHSDFLTVHIYTPPSFPYPLRNSFLTSTYTHRRSHYHIIVVTVFPIRCIHISLQPLALTSTTSRAAGNP